MHCRNLTQRMALVVALAGFAGSAYSAEESNALKDARKGDWITFQVTATGKEKTVSIIVTYTVIEKDEKNVSLKTEQKLGDQVKASEKKISLDQPFDLLSGKEGADPRVKIVAEGKELVKLGGKEYACRWIKKEADFDLKTTVNIGGKKDTSTIHNTIESQDWIAPNVAFGGVVKRKVKMNSETTIEYDLQDQGKAK